MLSSNITFILVADGNCQNIVSLLNEIQDYRLVNVRTIPRKTDMTGLETFFK